MTCRWSHSNHSVSCVCLFGFNCRHCHIWRNYGSKRTHASSRLAQRMYISFWMLTIHVPFCSVCIFQHSTLFCVFIYSYRAIVLRALPNLEMLDNVSVTPEELADAMKGGNAAQSQEEIYEDAYSNGPSQQQTQQQQYQQQPPPPQQQQQQQQYRQSSPIREVCVLKHLQCNQFSYFKAKIRVWHQTNEN